MMLMGDLIYWASRCHGMSTSLCPPHSSCSVCWMLTCETALTRSTWGCKMMRATVPEQMDVCAAEIRRKVSSINVGWLSWLFRSHDVWYCDMPHSTPCLERGLKLLWVELTPFCLPMLRNSKRLRLCCCSDVPNWVPKIGANSGSVGCIGSEACCHCIWVGESFNKFNP